jgi:hypothetical protein
LNVAIERLLFCLLLIVNFLIFLQGLPRQLHLTAGLIGASKLIVQATVIIDGKGSFQIWDGFAGLTERQIGARQRSLRRQHAGRITDGLNQQWQSIRRLLRLQKDVAEIIVQLGRFRRRLQQTLE